MEKRFIIAYSNHVILCNKKELQHFVNTAVLNNEDITSFTVVDRTRYHVVSLATILTVLYSEIKNATLYNIVSRIVTFLYTEKEYDTIDDIIVAYL